MTATQAPAVARGSVPEFTIELGDECNRSWFIIAAMQGLRVRGRWSLEALHTRTDPSVGRLGEPIGSRDVGEAMQAMPTCPGQHMVISPSKLTVEVKESSRGDDALWRRINVAARKGKVNISDMDLAPMAKDVTHKLDKHQMKSLLREILMMHEEKQCVTVVKGRLPRKDEVEGMAGDFLFDPMNTGGSKPRFRKDYEAWREKVDRR